MSYVKSFFYCFFVVFFVNYLIPGVDVVALSKIPYLKGDMLFAIGLGFLNFAVLPILKLTQRSFGVVKLGLMALILNIIGYGFLKFINVGVFVTTLDGYLFAVVASSVGCFLVNFFHNRKPQIEVLEEKPLDSYEDF